MVEMSPDQVTTILRQFNGWRRDFENKFEQPDSREIGEAIDAAVEMIERLEAAEKERDDVAQQLVQSEQGKRKISEECDALCAKIKAMEKQEPVATVRINAINGNPSVDFVPGHRYLHHNDKLYLAPGAQGE